jgi:hypothetical protein
MTRIIVSLDEREKSWLERTAREKGVSMAEVVRHAVRQLHKTEEKSLQELLDATRGVWRSGDGLRYQRKIRREWK